MFKLIVVGILSLTTLAANPVNEDIVREIKSKATWKPMEVNENPFKSHTQDEVASMLGGKNLTTGDHGLPAPKKHATMVSSPASFDSRQQWPSCIDPPRNQGKCGSCWAFASSEVLTDRFCIFSQGNIKVLLSPESLLECSRAGTGCKGGYPAKAFQFAEQYGVTSDACMPYTSGQGQFGYCPQTCADGTPVQQTRKYTCQQGSSFQAQNRDQMHQAIIAGGPIATVFQVYEDFMSYKSGVYSHVTGEHKGGHVVKVVGWGNEAGQDYWVVANSWGTSWGEGGYFKIAYGQCGIDQMMYGCIPNAGQAPPSGPYNLLTQ